MDDLREKLEAAWEEFEVAAKPSHFDGDTEFYSIESMVDAAFDLKQIADAAIAAMPDAAAIRAQALREAAAKVRAISDQRCEKCGYPRNNHLFRHPFTSSEVSDPEQVILALIDQPAPAPDPVAEAARVLLKNPKPGKTMDVICAFIEANRTAPAYQLADGAIGAFLRALYRTKDMDATNEMSDAGRDQERTEPNDRVDLHPVSEPVQSPPGNGRDALTGDDQ